MSAINPKVLSPFFQEVREQIGLELKYLPDDHKFPIQLADPEGVAKQKCIALLNFIETQVDLRDNEVGNIHPHKHTGRYLFDVSLLATQKIAEVYALSFFFDSPLDEEEPAP